MRLLKKILLYTFTVLLFLFTVSVILVYAYEDDIKAYAVKKLNEHLNAKVSVSQIEFSLWGNFPYAVLEFRNVHIEDAWSDDRSRDTMLHADRIYMELNVWDLIDGNNKVRHVYAEGGQVNIRIAEDGETNYGIWKSSEEAEEEDDDFSFELRKVGLKDMAFRYHNAVTEQDYKLYVKQGSLHGDFYKTQYVLGGDLDLRVDAFWNHKVNLVRNANASASVELKIDEEADLYQIDRGKLKIEDMAFNVVGSVVLDSVNTCDLDITGDQIKLSSFFSSFSETLYESFATYSSTGIVDFKAHVDGAIDKESSPHVEASFVYQDGTIREPDSGVELSNATVEGSFTNRNEDGFDEVRIDKFSGKLPDGHLDGHFLMYDFANPIIDGSIHGDMNLETVQKFLKLESVNRISGHLAIDSDIKIKISEPDDFATRNVTVYRSTGQWRATDVSLRLRESDLQFDKLNGVVIMQGNDAAIKDFTAMVGKSDIAFDGGFKNLIPYVLFNNQKLQVVANVDSRNIFLEDFIGQKEGTATAAEAGPESFNLPWDLDLNLQLDVNALTYGDFNSTDVTSQLILMDQVLRVRDLSLKTAEGRLSGWFRVDGTKPGVFDLTSQTSVSGMRVEQLFSQFENFGQSVIQPDNITGRLSATVEFNCDFDGGLNIRENSIYAQADVKLQNGALIELGAMKEITDYMREKKSTNLFFRKHIDDLERRLSRIEFSTLENHITVNERTVIIPKMSIGSSVMNINLSGTHTFNNEIDYSFDFKFRDLKMQEGDSEFGYIVDDGTGIKIFLRMYGTVDDPSFEWDKASRKESFRERLVEEKQNTKAILKENLGLFKNDTTLKVKERKPDEVQFILYEGELEEENAPEVTSPEDKNRKRRSNKSRASKFYEKLRKQKEEEEKIQFEIDDEPVFE